MSHMRLYLVGVTGSALLLACSSVPTRYFLLDDIVPAPVAGPVATTPRLAVVPMVRVEPIVIPAALDRLGLVTRNGPNRVRISATDRWAASLDEQIRRVVTDDLAARLPPQSVAAYSEPAGAAPRQLLSIVVTDFYADAHCVVTLHAQWTLQRPHADDRHGSEQIQIPAQTHGRTPRRTSNETLCVDNAASTMSRALGVLADRLAPVIAASS